MPIIGTSASQNSKSFLQPNAPTDVSAANIGTSRAYNNGAATVTFTPAASGAAATSFTVTSSPGSYTATGSSSPLTVTGLQSSTAYTFTVVASNAAGDSSASSASASITATTVPAAPTIGTATSGAAGSGEISVAFTAGATGGSSVTSYTATSSPGSITGSGSSSPVTVSGLTPGINYTFTVTATNANGTSAASSSSNSVTAAEIPKAAFAVAGYRNEGPGPVQNYDGMKLTQSNETISTFGYFDNNQQNYGHANSGVAGYTGGGIGFSSDQRKTIITRVNFANDGTYVAANFPVARFNVSSIPNTGSFGYWLGGSNASTFNPDYYKMTYSNDSLSTLSNPGFSPNNAAAGLENKGVAGYTAGGSQNTGKFGESSSRIYKVNYSTDVISLLGITLTETASERSFGLNNSGTSGYVHGPGFNASKLTYSTETVNSVSSIWGASISFQAGTASGIRGVAGYLWRGSSAGTTHKFTYSTETGNTLGATYDSRKTSMGGFANGGSY